MCHFLRQRQRRLPGTVSAGHLSEHTTSRKAIVITQSLYMSVYAGSFDAVLNRVLCCHRPLWVCFNACWKSLYSDWVTAGSEACAPPAFHVTFKGTKQECTPAARLQIARRRAAESCA